MVAFAEEPTIDTYHIEVAGEEKIKEHLAKPRNWVPQRHETLPEIPPDTAFLCSPADVPGPCRVQLQDKDITTDIRQKFEELCEEYGEAFCNVVLLHCGCLSLNPFIEFSIWNNSSSSDVLNI